jgi:hypothetical protein
MTVTLGVLLVRDPHAVTTPVMHCEDGSVVFPFYYDLGFTIDALIAGLTRFYAGYVSLAQNVVGFAVSRFPTRWQPHLLVLVPMLVSAAGFSAFSLPIFRKFVESDVQRAVICIGLVLLPLGNFAIIGVTNYLQLPIAIVLSMFVLSEAAPRVDRAGGLLSCFVLAALIWSTPLSVTLIPVFAYEGLRRRAAGWATLGGQLALVVAAALFGALGRAGPRTAVRIDAVSAGDVASAVSLWLRAIPERVVFGSAVGNEARLTLLRGGQQVLLDLSGVLIGLLILLALWSRMRAHGDFRRLVWKAVYMIAAYTALSAAFRTLDPMMAWGHRYTYPQSVLVGLLLFIGVTDRMLDRGVYGRALGAVVVLVWLSWLNLLNNGYYTVSPEDGVRVREFVRSVRVAERKGAGAELTLDRGPWSIRIVVPRSSRGDGAR